MALKRVGIGVRGGRWVCGGKVGEGGGGGRQQVGSVWWWAAEQGGAVAVGAHSVKKAAKAVTVNREPLTPPEDWRLL